MTVDTHVVASKVAYVGWTGQSNLGDDAIAEAVAAALPGAVFEDAPIGTRTMVDAMLRPARHTDRHLVLGGGTVLGRRIWRLHLGAALRHVARRPAFMLGPGVEDPAFARRRRLPETRELNHWRPLLGAFDRVTVRGPRSLELLTDAGIDAVMIGDPALLCGMSQPGARGEGVVGVVLGCGDDLWGHDQARVVAEAAAAIATVLGPRSVRFLTVNPADAPSHVRAASLLGLPTGRIEVVRAWTPAAFDEAVEGCEVVVSQRLHGAVLAAGRGVPVAMIEYQPKCRDFMASIGAADLCARTDDLRGLAGVIERVLAEGNAIATEQAAHVAALRALLQGEAGRIREALTG
jgi:polysaccharide pyruvyl transferase WcaK-like protein